MELSVFALRLAAAMVGGGLIGLERELSNKSAGLKTNMLVSIGACIYVLINLSLVESQGAGDPTRIIGQIVTGIGFLGGGVILHRGLNVHGLTTAATIWCSAAVGCLAGLGMFKEAGVATLAVLTVNFALKKLDGWFDDEIQKRKKGE
ncbi:MAG TPA: MgtC/SapB family protein [Bacteroidales bacterium]|nr:MgtC/SapB family protein [Bacteroidales bacterium]